MSTELLPIRSVDWKRRFSLHVESDPLPCEESERPVQDLAQAVYDRYRCPDTFLDFGLSGALPSKQGYFQFGPDTTCYGRTCSGIREDPRRHPERVSETVELISHPFRACRNKVSAYPQRSPRLSGELFFQPNSPQRRKER